MFEVNEIVLWVIGLAVSVLVYVVNYIRRTQGKEIKREWLTGVIYVLSLLIVLVFGRFSFPLLPVFPIFPAEPLAYIGALIESLGLLLGYLGQWLTLLTAVAGFAALPYNLLYKQVFDKVFPLPQIAKG